MNILYIVPYVPNLIRVRPYQLIRTLLRRGHRVTLATVWTSAQEVADLQALAAVGVRVLAERQPRWRSLWNSIGALPSATPLQAVYSWQPTLAQMVLTAIQSEPFDVVQVEHLRGARYGLHLQAWCKQQQINLPVIWDSVDCISHLFAQAAQRSRSHQGRWMTKLELARTRTYEGWLVHQFNPIVVTSAADQRALAQLAQQHPTRQERFDGSRFRVLPNGVDLDYFYPNGMAREPATLVFSGKLSYHANVTAAIQLVKEIMPLVWARWPEVQLYLVGKDPSPQVRALATPFASMPDRPSVVVTGTVDDIRPYLCKASLAVAPIPYGAGIQNKVLEAMACGTPVVASPQAVSALTVDTVSEIAIADDVAAFAQAILTLLADPARRATLGRRGRDFVERHHSWQAAAAALEEIYGSTLSTGGDLHEN